MQRTYGFAVRSTGHVATLLSHQDGKSAEVGKLSRKRQPTRNSKPDAASWSRRPSTKSLHVATPDEQLAKTPTKASSNATSPLTASPLFACSYPSGGDHPGDEIVIVQVAAEFASGWWIECPVHLHSSSRDSAAAGARRRSAVLNRLSRVAKTRSGGVDGAASSRLRVDLGSLDSMDSRCRIPLSCKPHTGTAHNLRSSKTAGRLCHVPGTRDTNRPTAPMPTRLQPGRQLPEQKSKSPVSS